MSKKTCSKSQLRSVKGGQVIMTTSAKCKGETGAIYGRTYCADADNAVILGPKTAIFMDPKKETKRKSARRIVVRD